MLISRSLVTFWFYSVYNIVAYWVNLDINKNYSYSTNIYKQKIEKTIYQKFIHLGENTFPYCSRIVVDHVHVNVFLTCSHSVLKYGKQNKTRKTLKTTDKHDAECSKAVFWGVKRSV